MDNRDQTRSLASEALGDLASPQKRLTTVVEKALRIASLRKHSYWRAWCEMQLRDLSEPQEITAFHHKMTSTLDLDREGKQIIENALVDYSITRLTPSRGQHAAFGGTLSTLEDALRDAELLQASMGTPPPDAIVYMSELRRALEKIRQRVRNYLIDVESETI